MLAQYLPSDPGVFLEVGANDGYSQSNTYSLERSHGWHGILIEPIPSLYKVCRRLRKGSVCFNSACVAKPQEVEIEMVDLNLISVAVGLQDEARQEERLRGRRGTRVRVPARTLSSIIDEAGEPEINFMSIDVEGAESEVLRGLDWRRHSPEYLLVETKFPGEIEQLAGPHMRFESMLTHHDFLYVRK